MLEQIALERHVASWTSDLLVPTWEVPWLLGLSPDITACLFSLDGVLAGTSAAHSAAWELTFNEFIANRIERTGGHFPRFDPRVDYYAHVHAKPRLAGVRAFLASRGIRHAGLANLVEGYLDGNQIVSQDLPVEPAPDTLLAALRLVSAEPGDAALSETTPAGVRAGRRCGFALVVGIAEPASVQSRLVAPGADIVAAHLDEPLDRRLATMHGRQGAPERSLRPPVS